MLTRRAKNFLDVNTYSNFFDSDIFLKKFNKIQNKESIAPKKMDILITDYGFDSNIIGCKLFESESSENETFGLSQTQLEEKFSSNQIITENDDKGI
jgi:hypothetical protein